MIKYGFWLQRISWARCVRFYQYYPCNKNGSFDDYFDLKRYWRTQSLLLEIQLNLFGDPASTNFINDPYVVGLESASPREVGNKHVAAYEYVPQDAIMSGGLKTGFSSWILQKNTSACWVVWKNWKEIYKNGFFLLREKSTFVTVPKIVGTLISVLYFWDFFVKLAIA